MITRLSLLFSLLALATGLHAQTIITRTLDTGTNGSTGIYTSQAIVNGNPAVAYYDASDGNLMFARNSAVDGSGTWTLSIIDSTGQVGQYTSLVVVNGNPAISYYDSANGDLKYVRATDASGTSWGTPVTLDSTGSVGFYTSLAVVNGNPAISYYDNSNGDLKYIRATTASGTLVGDWGTPVTLDSTGTVGQFASAARQPRVFLLSMRPRSRPPRLRVARAPPAFWSPPPAAPMRRTRSSPMWHHRL